MRLSRTRTESSLTTETTQEQRLISQTRSQSVSQADPYILTQHSEMLRVLSGNHPILKSPTVPVGDDTARLTQQAMVTLLLGQQALYASKTTEIQMANNLDALIKQLTATQHNFEQLSVAFRSAVSEAGEATGALSNARNAYETALEHREKAKALDHELAVTLSQLTDNHPEHADVLRRKQQSEAALRFTENNVQSTYKAFIATAETADSKVALAVELEAQIRQTERNSVIQTNVNCLTQSAQNKTSLSQLILLITTLLQEVGESNEESIRQQTQQLDVMNQARLNELSRTAEESASKQQTLKTVSKALSFAAMIFTGIMVVAGIIAAIPTGGVSLGSIIGLGVALTSGAIFLADVICQVTVDFSPTAWLFGEMAEGVTWLVDNTFGETLEKCLEYFGVDDKLAKDIRDDFSMIAGDIGTAAIIIGGMVVCAAGVAGATKALSEVGEAAFQAVNTSLKAFSEKAVAKVIITVQKIATRVMIPVSQLYSAIISAACSLNEGIVNNELIDMLADMGLTQQDIKNIADIKKNLLSTVKSVDDTVMTLIQMLADTLQERTQTLSQGYSRSL